MDKKPIYYESVVLKENIEKCEDIEDFKNEILVNIYSQRELWKEKINEIFREGNYSQSSFAKACCVSRVAVGKWLNGAIPRNREYFIRIGLAAHYDIAEMNRLLTRYGRYPALYAKSLEDCTCIFVLSSEIIPHDYLHYKNILDTVKSRMHMVDSSEPEIYSTIQAFDSLIQLSTEKELIDFVNEKSAIYKTQYNRLYEYIEENIAAQSLVDADGKKTTTYFLANEQQWSSSLRQCVSAISQKKWYPNRNKIISLGIHLNMGTDQINEMLKLAYMEPLCVRNPFESAVMYALESAYCEGIGFDGDLELCLYVKDILEELNIPDADFFLNELPDEVYDDFEY